MPTKYDDLKNAEIVKNKPNSNEIIRGKALKPF